MKLYIANNWYAGTQAEAKKISRDFEQVEVPTDKEGLIQFLNTLALGAGEGEPPTLAERQDPPIYDKPIVEAFQRSTKPSYTEQSVNWDEQFAKLPIAHQLHFAAMAMENARDQLALLS